MTVTVTTTSVTTGGTIQSVWGNEVLADLNALATVSNGVTPINQGGTGQVTAASAFAALYPGTTKGDFIVYSGSQPTRLPVGNANQLPVANSAFPNGIGYATLDEPNELVNVSFTAVATSNAMVITLTDKSLATLTTTNQALGSFRSATLSSGASLLRAATSAITLTIPNGGHFGQGTTNTLNGLSNPAGLATTGAYVFVYLIDNAGTLELAVSGCGPTILDEGLLWTTTAIGACTSSFAAGGSPVLWSTTGRSNVAIRFVGRFYSTQTVAGTYVNNPTEITVGQHAREVKSAFLVAAGASTTISSESTVIAYSSTLRDALTEWDATNNRFIAKSAGVYTFTVDSYIASMTDGQQEFGHFYINGSPTFLYANARIGSTGDGCLHGTCTAILNAGDYVQPRVSTGAVINGSGGGDLGRFTGFKVA